MPDIHMLLILALGLIAFVGGSWSGYRDGFAAGQDRERVRVRIGGLR